ncbi:MAG: DUF3592 domain-containing protein [Chthoniobacter sp.]|nr:DUF3592 domain-containing protein [Chthoniobacter sp.]
MSDRFSLRDLTLLGLLGLGLLVFGALSKIETSALEAQGLPIEARVTESREKVSKGVTSYEVRYAIKPTPESPEIVRRDFLGRTNTWASLPEPAFRAAVASGKLQVRYVPSKPGNSAPVESRCSSRSAWLVMGIGALLLGAGITAFLRQNVPSQPNDTAHVEPFVRRSTAELLNLPVLRAKAAPKCYAFMACFAILPLTAAVWVLFKQPSQIAFSLICFCIVGFCFLNIASIRFLFDGETISYSSILKRSIVSMDQVIGALIGYARSGQHKAPFFYLRTRDQGEVMLNLGVFRRSDSREFCRRLALVGITPEVASGFRARLLKKELYPQTADRSDSASASS